MNKTIIININGIVFHIEEDAYEVLKSYMTEVKRHFAYSKDSQEIVTDIENRFAEMFTERLQEQNRQVIILQDVEEITAKMGKVSDFEPGEEDTAFDYSKIKSSRTLYKDGDDKVIAGVCAGLAHYFDMEVKWVRLITAVATLFSGIGLIPYLILWIVLPVARTRQEKLAMKGEAINIHTFKKSFDEEAQSAKSQDYSTIKSNDPVKEVVSFIGKILAIVVKVIGIFIVGAGAIILIGLIIALLFGLGFINSAEFYQFPFNVINPEYRSPVFFSAFLLIFIPLIALILFAIRVILNRKIVSRYGSFAMLILWLTGLAMGVYYGSRIASEFREEAKFEQSAKLSTYPTLVLKLNQEMLLTAEDSLKYNIDTAAGGKIIYGDNSIDHEIQHFDLFIEKGDDTSLVVLKQFTGRGKNFEHALQSAKKVNYQVSQKDSVIHFDKYMSLSGDRLFRAQELDVRLKVPVNTRLVIDGRLDWRLRGYDLSDCQPEDSSSSEPSVWIMTEEGLKCEDQELYERKRNN